MSRPPHPPWFNHPNNIHTLKLPHKNSLQYFNHSISLSLTSY
jgi:hypothetical protein